jgi:hypothetical protein
MEPNVYVVSVYWNDGAYDSIEQFNYYQEAKEFADNLVAHYRNHGNPSGAVSVQVVCGEREMV